MPPFFRFLLLRLISFVITLLGITVLLYGVIYTFPVETRAMLYFPKNPGKNFKESSEQIIINDIIRKYRLDDPFPVQYTSWMSSVLRGDWGYSASAGEDVLPALIRLMPATAELTLYSLLLFFPLGVLSGIVAGVRKGRPTDAGIRVAASIVSSIPPFILAILMLAVFYVALRWFPPERLSDATRIRIGSDGFRTITGFLTVDGLLNNRFDVTYEAFQHLVLPVVTLSAFHWATLTRITRSAIIEELQKTYIIAARARGLPNHTILFRHALRNTLAPALNSTALSAAGLVTGVFIIERIYNFWGVSNFIRNALEGYPDIPAALGFSVFAILMVLVFMLVFDILKAVVDPRHREEMGQE